MRAALARALAGAGAAAMLVPSDKPNRMLYTSAFGFYPRAPLPVLSVASRMYSSCGGFSRVGPFA